MDAKKSMAIDNGIVLIDSILCPTVTKVMLSTGSNFVPTQSVDGMREEERIQN